MTKYVLYGNQGWGSTLVEAQLALYGLDFEWREVGDLFDDAEARSRLQRHNPLAQVPTLILPDGMVMTESAAITLYLAEVTGSDRLVPPPGDACRPDFLRWLVFAVANIYPTFTYADDPARFVPQASARDAFRDTVNDYAKRLLSVFDAAAGSPWFLGERRSALDIYVCVMTRWRPGRAWHAEHCKRLTAIARRLDDADELQAVWARNFPASEG